MILSLKVSDETFQQYAAYDTNSPQRAMERQLERYKEHSPTARTVLLTDESRKALELLFGRPLEDQGQFVQWVKGLTTVKIGEIEVPLSQGQIKRIQGNAQFWKESTEDFARKQIVSAVNNALGGA